MLRARGRAFQAGLSRRALRAAFATWQEARVARACVALWRSHVQGARAGGRRRRARAQQAFTAWRVALGQRREARQQAEDRARAQTQLALCWALWVQESRLRRLSRAHAARKLSTRVLEAWARSAAQGRVRRVAVTQFQLVGHRRLLRTQWRTELLSVWLGPPMEAQETSTALPRPRADLAHWHGLAGRGRLLALMDTAAPWKQARSCRPPGTGPRLPSPAPHRSLGGQRARRKTSGAQSDSAAQLWMQRPGPTARGPPPPGPGGDCSSEGQGDERWLGRKYLRRWHREALLRRLRGSQQARRLAGTWQCWVDAQGAEELARSLLRQWQLRWVWRTWRRRVVQLQVAQRLRRRAEGWVRSQAFEKWHRNLAARGLRRGHRQLESPE